jgi:hypothetical protein
MRQYSLYMFFAAAAILVNLITQGIIEQASKNFFQGFAYTKMLNFNFWFLSALAGGTIMGFIFKYLIDKLVIFKSVTTIAGTTEEVLKYLLFAIFTTLIFWGTEILFILVLGEPFYLIGGLIGLIIGYTLKFFLDKNYVFASSK